ncbi:hypothetical protein JAAARDRAFT_200496 [Jaapia argillacea MUCL 33604]|uniref:Uncharacterized protein n=1 Tax=Jaapia argillacea MUCL 33604 TaxID=933084 RepID=A0A067P4Z1_9AGAM|nr:hypothetical protein JAAARDRAFT_200496 [Jaapia argillacea MUCL 33604]
MAPVERINAAKAALKPFSYVLYMFSHRVNLWHSCIANASLCDLKAWIPFIENEFDQFESALSAARDVVNTYPDVYRPLRLTWLVADLQCLKWGAVTQGRRLSAADLIELSPDHFNVDAGFWKDELPEWVHDRPMAAKFWLAEDASTPSVDPQMISSDVTPVSAPSAHLNPHLLPPPPQPSPARIPAIAKGKSKADAQDIPMKDVDMTAGRESEKEEAAIVEEGGGQDTSGQELEDEEMDLGNDGRDVPMEVEEGRERVAGSSRQKHPTPDSPHKVAPKRVKSKDAVNKPLEILDSSISGYLVDLTKSFRMMFATPCATCARANAICTNYKDGGNCLWCTAKHYNCGHKGTTSALIPNPHFDPKAQPIRVICPPNKGKSKAKATTKDAEPMGLPGPVYGPGTTAFSGLPPDAPRIPNKRAVPAATEPQTELEPPAPVRPKLKRGIAKGNKSDADPPVDPTNESQPPAPVPPKTQRGAPKATVRDANPPAVAPPPKRPSHSKKSKSKEVIVDSEEDIAEPEKPKAPLKEGGKRSQLIVHLPPKPKPVAGGSKITTIDFEPKDPKVKIQVSSAVLDVPMSYPLVPKFQDRIANAVGILLRTQDELNAIIQRAVDKAMEKIVEEELKPLCDDVVTLKAKSRKLEKLCEELLTEVDSTRKGLSDLRSVAITSDDIAKLEKAHDADMRKSSRSV